MARTCLCWLAVLALVGGVAIPADAQTGGSSIAGVVKDDTGGALPGVTVEVTSPALIERVRTAVTNGSGAYEIVDLRAGVYAVTFSLAGFKVVRQEAIELSSAFTATVNAVLSVGDVAETITVTAESPLIDVRNAVSGRALKSDVIDALPVGRNVYQIGLLMQGATTTAPDVGGNQAAQITNLRVNGVQDNTWLADGLEINGVEADTVTATYYNQGFNAETTIQTSALPAEASGGVTVNMIKKDGSNLFKGDLYSSYTSKSLQSRNVSDEQRANGLVAPSATDEAYDFNLGLGGPVLRERLWFYGSYRRWRVDRLTANTFNIGGTQALDEQILSNWSGRLTLKVTENNRLSGWVETLDKLRGHRRNLSATIQFISPEAAVVQPNIGTTGSIRWTSTLKSNLLLEGGFASMRIVWGQQYRPDSPPDAIPRNDLDFATLTGATPNALDSELDWRRTAGFAVTWLPSFLGSHKFRAGTQLSWGVLEDERSSRTDFLARYRSGVPDSVIVYNTPITTKILQDDHAWYVQDSWTLARLTINAGVRWQMFRGVIPQQTSQAGRFVPQRTFAKLDNIPNWKDYTPRLAVVYDLFGDGRTAIKANVSKYVSRTSAGSIVSLFNPARLLNETRTWVDANRDGIPQLAEIGPTRGGLTAAASVRIDPALRRPYQWEQSVTLEHQLQQSLAVAVSYYHREFPLGYTTLNVAVSPADYVPVTIASPFDGSPFIVYNQTAASASRVDNVVTNSEGLRSWYHALQVAFDKRMTNDVQISGGFTIGSDRVCSGASTNPNSQVNNCGYTNSDSRFMGNMTLVYRLPWWGVTLASNLQQKSGQPLATTYTVTRADIPNLTQVSQSVNLLAVGERRKEPWTILDVRLSKTFRFGARSIEPVAEVYNLLNENASLSEVTTVGPTLGRVSSNVDGRIAKFGLKILF
jgi:hypothetical protein